MNAFLIKWQWLWLSIVLAKKDLLIFSDGECKVPIKCLEGNLFTHCFIVEGRVVIQKEAVACPANYKCVEDPNEPCRENNDDELEITTIGVDQTTYFDKHNEKATKHFYSGTNLPADFSSSTIEDSTFVTDVSTKCVENPNKPCIENNDNELESTTLILDQTTHLDNYNETTTKHFISNTTLLTDFLSSTIEDSTFVAEAVTSSKLTYESTEATTLTPLTSTITLVYDNNENASASQNTNVLNNATIPVTFHENVNFLTSTEKTTFLDNVITTQSTQTIIATQTKLKVPSTTKPKKKRTKISKKKQKPKRNRKKPGTKRRKTTKISASTKNVISTSETFKIQDTSIMEETFSNVIHSTSPTEIIISTTKSFETSTTKQIMDFFENHTSSESTKPATYTYSQPNLLRQNSNTETSSTITSSIATTSSTTIPSTSPNPILLIISPLSNCEPKRTYPAEKCVQYYQCIQVLWWTEAVLRSCPNNQAYSFANQKCMNGNETTCTSTN